MDKSTHFNFYKIISENFIAVLGQDNWFYDGQDIIPVNPYTNNAFSGFNQFILSAYANKFYYRFNRWLTIGQVHELGAKAKTGQIPVTTVFPAVEYFSDGQNVTEEVNIILEEGGQQPDNVSKSVSALRVNVFNIDQCENLPSIYFAEKEYIRYGPEPRFDILVELAKNVHANIQFSEIENPQFYPLQDIIVSPRYSNEKPELFAKLAYKIAAWSGGRNWLKRNSRPAPQDQGNLLESLTCELLAAILCANLGFSYPINVNPLLIAEWRGCIDKDMAFAHNAVQNALYRADYLIEANSYGMRRPEAKKLFK